MIQYLNGVSEMGKLKIKPKFTKPFKNFGKGVKALDEKRKALNRKIVDDAKKLAKNAGKGLLRIALIPKNFAFKKLLFALEHDLYQMSTRIKILYKRDAADTKNFLSTLGDYAKIVEAVNKGVKAGGNIGAVKNTRQEIKDCYDAKGSPIFTSGGVYTGCGGCKGCVGAPEGGSGDGQMTAAQYEEYSKEAVGLIAKIIAWFRKRKADKAGDAAIEPDLTGAVDTDPHIPVVDENGDILPTSPLAPKGGNMTTMLLIGGGVLAAGYFLLKKK